MNLADICGEALHGIGQFNAPASVVGNTDPTAVNLLALANRSGKSLARLYDWEVLRTDYTFTTSNGTESYALPTDYAKFAGITQWDRTNYRRIEGPVSASRWQYLKSSNLATVTAWKHFRIAGGLFYIHPTPTATETIAYTYISKYWIDGKAAFSDDEDEPLLDADLMVADLRWRFLAAKGAPYAEEKDEFERLRDRLLADDGGKGGLYMGSRPFAMTDNLPDSDFG